MERNKKYFLLLSIALNFVILFQLGTHHSVQVPEVQIPKVVVEPVAPKARIPNISTTTPSFLEYKDIVSQLKTWNQEAPDLTTVSTYGKTKQNQDLFYIRIFNKIENKKCPKVLITGCIHGNEPWSTAEVMAYAGNLLGEYGKNKEVTDIVNSRDIYIVPVISPDSYPFSRYVDKVDPNRDFPGPNRPTHSSTPSVKAIQDLFEQIKPNAVLAGHTYGRIYLTPYGDKRNLCPNQEDFTRIVGKMAQMSDYKIDRACNLYGKPILGSEVDWYYRNGAFAIVMEIGTHQEKPTKDQIASEFIRTWESVKHFLKEAPLVEIKPNNLMMCSFLTKRDIVGKHLRQQTNDLALSNQY